MRWGTRLGVVLAAVAAGAGASLAQAPLASVADVRVPGGPVVRVALPPGSCEYPREMRERAARFLSEGEHGLLLLGAAGDCADMGRLARGEVGYVTRSMQLAIRKDEEDPGRRTKPAEHRRACFEQFPKVRETLDSDALREALKRADDGLDLGSETSLGLLAATRDAVFGGTVTAVAREPVRLDLVQVTACFSPNEVPLLWTFQETVARAAGEEAEAAALRRVLALARSEVELTMGLNRPAGSRP